MKKIEKLEFAIKEYYKLMIATDRLYVELSKKSGISFIQMIILYHLEYTENNTQKNLCDDLYLSKQTVNTILSHWKREGIIELYFADGNHKQKQIKFTEKGRIYLNESLSLIHKAERNVMENMGEENIKMLLDANRMYLKLLKEEVVKNE